MEGRQWGAVAGVNEAAAKFFHPNEIGGRIELVAVYGRLGSSS